MMKRLVFFKRRAGLDVAAFHDHMGLRHAELLAAWPGVSAATVHLTHESGYRAHEPSYDAVVEVCFADDDDVRTVGGVEAGRVWDDASAVADPTTLGSVAAREVVILDGGPSRDGLTMFAFLNRRAGTERSDFQTYWHGHHGPIAQLVPGLRRYVQNHVVDVDGEGPPGYDGVAQTWFDDLDAVRRGAGSAELQRTRDDEPNFMVSGRLPFVICTPLPVGAR